MRLARASPWCPMGIDLSGERLLTGGSVTRLGRRHAVEADPFTTAYRKATGVGNRPGPPRYWRYRPVAVGLEPGRLTSAPRCAAAGRYAHDSGSWPSDPHLHGFIGGGARERPIRPIRSWMKAFAYSNARAEPADLCHACRHAHCPGAVSQGARECQGVRAARRRPATADAGVTAGLLGGDAPTMATRMGIEYGIADDWQLGIGVHHEHLAPWDAKVTVSRAL